MSDQYNGLTVGDTVIAVPGDYLLEVLYLGEIPDGGIWAIIPHTQPRIWCKALVDYPDLPKGGNYDCHPTHVKKWNQ